MHLKRGTTQAAAFVRGCGNYNGVLHSTLRSGEVTGRASAVAHQNALVMTFSCGHIEGRYLIQLPANRDMVAVTVRVCSDGGEGTWSCRWKRQRSVTVDDCELVHISKWKTRMFECVCTCLNLEGVAGCASAE